MVNNMRSSTVGWQISMQYDDSGLCNSYTMATRDLPDIYARALGPAALGLGHIYQVNHEWPWYK